MLLVCNRAIHNIRWIETDLFHVLYRYLVTLFILHFRERQKVNRRTIFLLIESCLITSDEGWTIILVDRKILYKLLFQEPIRTIRFLYPLILTLSNFPDSFANLYDGFIFTHQILTIVFLVLRSRSQYNAMAYSGPIMVHRMQKIPFSFSSSAQICPGCHYYPEPRQESNCGFKLPWLEFSTENLHILSLSCFSLFNFTKLWSISLVST